MINIVANPLTLLSPKINKIRATTKVVKLPSRIEAKEFLLPFLTALFNLLPFFNSSLILEKLITLESTAIPIPINTAAIPGKVRTPPTSQNIANTSAV